VGDLRIEPKARVGVEVAPKAECRVGGHTAALAHDLADGFGWDADGSGQLARAHLKRCKILLTQDLAGVGTDAERDGFLLIGDSP